MNDVTMPALAKPRPKPPETVGELLRSEEATTRRLSAVATRHLSAERAAHLAISAVRKTPLLAKCTPASFMGSLMGATGLGLEPNTLKDHAYLIPYKRRQPRRDQNRQIMEDANGRWIFDEWYECQLQIGYKGFITLLYRSPLVSSVDAEAIYDVDHFRHTKGTNTVLEFEKSLTKQRVRPIPEDALDRFMFSPGLQGAFCFTKLHEGQAFTVTPLEDLYKARSRSQAWNSVRGEMEVAEVKLKGATTDKAKDAAQKQMQRAHANYFETPWVLYEDAMSAKTSIRRHAKQADLDDDREGAQISLAADLDALGDAGTIDMEALADPDRAQAIMRGEENIRHSGVVPGHEEDIDDAERKDNAADADSGGETEQPDDTKQGKAGPSAENGESGPQAAPTAKKEQKDLF